MDIQPLHRTMGEHVEMSKNGVYQGFLRTKANKMRQICTILALYLLFLMLTVFLCNVSSKSRCFTSFSNFQRCYSTYSSHFRRYVTKVALQSYNTKRMCQQQPAVYTRTTTSEYCLLLLFNLCRFYNPLMSVSG